VTSPSAQRQLPQTAWRLSSRILSDAILGVFLSHAIAQERPKAGNGATTYTNLSGLSLLRKPGHVVGLCLQWTKGGGATTQEE